jgi:hypothetical protein
LRCGDREVTAEVAANGVALPVLIPCTWRVVSPLADVESLRVDEQTVELELRVRTPTVPVRIAVFDEKGRAIGERLRVRCGEQEVSGQVSMMGEVELPLWPCSWVVSGPRRTLEGQLEVDASTTRLEVHLIDAAALVIRGKVVDAEGRPVRALVQVRGEVTMRLETAADGTFVTSTVGRSAVVSAVGSSRSRPVRVEGPSADVLLRVEEPAELSVRVFGPGASTATVIVMDGATSQSSSAAPHTLSVLRGHVAVVASSVAGGVLVAARASFEVESPTHGRALRLTPPPPLVGTLVREDGEPMAGARLALVPIGNTTEDLLGATDTGSEAAWGTTAGDGSFSVDWPAKASLFRVEIIGHALERPALVAPFAAPLRLVALRANGATTR